jgi:hypothetical protein
MTNVSRREFTLGGLGMSLTATLWSRRSNAAAAVMIDPSDPTAKALGFVTDAKDVDTAANPAFKPTQKCATCAQYQGKPTDPSAVCNIFAGKAVPAAGWCKVWVARPSG